MKHIKVAKKLLSSLGIALAIGATNNSFAQLPSGATITNGNAPPASINQESIQWVPIGKLSITRINPQDDHYIYINTENLSTVTENGTTRVGDTAIAVIRYRDKPKWRDGNDPFSRGQESFDVVAFSDDYNKSPAPTGNDQKASWLAFVSDGLSHYDIIVFNPSNTEPTTAIPQADLVIKCSSCGFSGGDTRTERVNIGGYYLSSVEGNVIQVRDKATTNNQSADPLLYSFRVFENSRTPTNDDYYSGYGVTNDDSTIIGGYMPRIKDANFNMRGRAKDFVLVGSYWTRPPGVNYAHVQTGYESQQVSGLLNAPSRPTNKSNHCLAPANAGDIKDDLEDTGCFKLLSNGNATENLEDFVIPYEIAQPFWSDGVIKERYFSLPDGASIEVKSDGTWELPPGGVMIKNFRFGTKLFETRMVAKTTNGDRLAYTYMWDWGDSSRVVRVDDESTPVTQYLDGGTALDPFASTTWEYPINNQCLQCHQENSNSKDEHFYLGLKSRQFNVDRLFSEVSASANQIHTFKNVGLITGSGPIDPPLPPRADSTVGEMVMFSNANEQARAWLDTNCGYCHDQTVPVNNGGWNADISNSFSGMNICNANSYPGKIRFVPGDYFGSYILDRVFDTSMPSLAINEPDILGGWLPLAALTLNTDSCSGTDVQLQLIDTRQCAERSGSGLTMKTCSSNNNQTFDLIDDGDNTIKIKAHNGNCVTVTGSNNVVLNSTCNSKEWRREWIHGAGFQIRNVNNPAKCLTAGSSTVQDCHELTTQMWYVNYINQ